VSNSLEWAGIVYTRTHHSDFRFLAIPNDFSENHIQWMGKYIKASMLEAEQLRGRPRWTYFESDEFIIYGVTCSLVQIIASKKERETGPHNQPTTKSKKDEKEGIPAQDHSHDEHGRPIYGFFGYACKRKPHLELKMPTYAGNNLHAYVSLYKHVQEKWLDREFNKQIVGPSKTTYEVLPVSCDDIKDRTPASDLVVALNYVDGHITIWPDKDNFLHQLWAAISATSDKHTLSLCTSLPSISSAIGGPFKNATAFDAESAVTYNERGEEIAIIEAKLHTSSVPKNQSEIVEREAPINGDPSAQEKNGKDLQQKVSDDKKWSYVYVLTRDFPNTGNIICKIGYANDIDLFYDKMAYQFKGRLLRLIETESYRELITGLEKVLSESREQHVKGFFVLHHSDLEAIYSIKSPLHSDDLDTTLRDISRIIKSRPFVESTITARIQKLMGLK
jgi:hypothetical protein